MTDQLVTEEADLHQRAPGIVNVEAAFCGSTDLERTQHHESFTQSLIYSRLQTPTGKSQAGNLTAQDENTLISPDSCL